MSIDKINLINDFITGCEIHVKTLSDNVSAELIDLKCIELLNLLEGALSDNPYDSLLELINELMSDDSQELSESDKNDQKILEYNSSNPVSMPIDAVKVKQRYIVTAIGLSEKETNEINVKRLKNKRRKAKVKERLSIKRSQNTSATDTVLFSSLSLIGLFPVSDNCYIELSNTGEVWLRKPSIYQNGIFIRKNEVILLGKVYIIKGLIGEIPTIAWAYKNNKLTIEDQKYLSEGLERIQTRCLYQHHKQVGNKSSSKADRHHRLKNVKPVTIIKQISDKPEKRQLSKNEKARLKARVKESKNSYLSDMMTKGEWGKLWSLCHGKTVEELQKIKPAIRM